jgi:hypothetical protein
MKTHLPYWQVGMTILFCAIAAHGQDKPESWHKIPITPSATPQCLVRKDPDQTTFLSCADIALLSHDYLRHHDVVIWTPPHYKIGPAGWLFWGNQIATAGLAVADVEATQHWLNSPGCKQPGIECEEINPVTGRSRLQGYSVTSAVLLFGIYESRKQRRYQVLREQVGLPQWKTFLYSWWLLDGVSDGLHFFDLGSSVWKTKQVSQVAR